MFYYDFRNIENWKNISYDWLTKWKGLNMTLERKIFEAMEQLVNTKFRRKDILNEKLDNNLCRICKKKKETVRHILSNCDNLAKGLYTNRHNLTLEVLYNWILNKYGFEKRKILIDKRNKPEPIVSNEKITIKWDMTVYTEDYTQSNRPDMLVIKHKKKKIIVIEMSCPWDKNLNKKIEEKENK